MTGELLALGAAFAFGLSSVAIAKGAKTSSGESGVLLSAIATAFFAGLSWMIFPGPSLAAKGGSVFWLALAWFAASGLMATVGGRITLFKSIEYAGVIRASTARRLMPFLSVLLAWLVIDERISLMAGGGMALIGLSFLLLYWENRASIRITTDDPRRRAMVSRGLAFGVASALLYALSFIARKFGLEQFASPFFGAFIGSVIALCFYAAAAMVSPHYRAAVAGVFSVPNSWQLLAALLMATGQISQFAALMLTDVGRVAFINSIEVYISAMLAVGVFRTEPVPGVAIVFAMALATAGVVLISVVG